MLQSRAGSVEEIKLNRVKICGFKSIKDCSVDLHDINILIGPNGSGKSNFISALCLLQKVLDKNLQETVGKTGLPAMLYGGVKTTQDIEMEFSFNFNSYGFELTTNDAGNLVFRKEYYGWGEGHWEVPRTPYGYESEYELGVKNNINSYVKPVLDANSKMTRVFEVRAIAFAGTWRNTSGFTGIPGDSWVRYRVFRGYRTHPLTHRVCP